LEQSHGQEVSQNCSYSWHRIQRNNPPAPLASSCCFCCQ